MWQVDEVWAENFLGYEKLHFRFSDKDGLTLIVGNRGSGRSNGAGKTTLFHVITYALYGRLTKRLDPIEKVIRRGADATKVSIKLSDQRGDVKITRMRNRKARATVETDGFDARALAAGQQEAIDARFGDFDLFTATSMFAGDVSSFCKLPDAQRKELLERMSNVGHYAAAAEAAKEDADQLTWAIEKQSNALATAEARLEELFAERAKYAYESFTWALRVKRRYRKMVAHAIEMAEECDEAFKAVSAWVGEAEALRDQASTAASKIAGQVTDLEEQRDAVEARIEKLSAIVNKITAGIEHQQDEIARLKSDRHEDTCPTCGQRWPQGGDADKIAERVAKHEQTIFDAKREAEPARAQLREEKEELVRLKEAIADLRRQQAAATARVDDSQYRRLLAAALELDAELTQEHKNIATFAEEHGEDPDDSALTGVDAAIEAVRADRDAAQTALEKHRTELEQAEFWKKGFGRSGLPSFLIDASLPAMTDIANDIARDLTDGELTVRFNAAAEKGSKSVFDVEVDYAEGGEGFDSVSHGEGTRVDMSVLFAIRDLAARRSGIECKQLFLDEVMDGADEAFVQAFVSMLRRRYADRQVFLISHEPSAASLCDRTVTVRKRRAIATIA